MAGILAFGGYVPRLRLQRAAIYAAHSWFAPGLRALARGERAIANWDEDAVTMAVEAARDCLCGRERTDIETIALASTSLPYLERQNSGIVKEALNLDDEVSTIDLGGSLKAGAGGLLQACRSAGSTTTLMIASEKREARPASEDELLNGDAAAAFLVGPGDGIARFVAGFSVSSDFVDHYRSQGEQFSSGWEARWVRDEGFAKLGAKAVAGLLERAGLAPGDIDHFIVGIPGAGIAAALAKKAGIATETVVDTLSSDLGSPGCAHSLVMLARCLEDAQPGQKLLVVGYGQGAEAILFETTAAITEARESLGISGWLARRAPEENYFKYLSLAGHLKLELGKRAEFEAKPVLTALYRNRKAVLGLVGGRCSVTGTVQFPPSDISVNPNQATVGTQEDYPLAEKAAKILTYTADTLTFTPDPPNYYGMIDFEGGGRMLAEFTDVDPDNVYVGAPMRMMFRIKGRDDRSGFTKYFWKAVPAAGEV